MSRPRAVDPPGLASASIAASSLYGGEQVERYVQISPWRTPVWSSVVDDERVAYDDRLLSSEPRWAHPERGGYLSRFVRLSDASARQVRAFVGQWGALYLCEAHWAPTHPYGDKIHRNVENVESLADGFEIKPSAGLKGHDLWNCGRSLAVAGDAGRMPVEPVPAWRRWAQIFDSLMLVALRLDKGQQPPRGDLDLLGIDPDNEEMLGLRLALWVNYLLQIGSVAPGLVWNETAGRADLVLFRSDSLFGALATQLALVASGAPKGLFLCAACWQVFHVEPDEKRRRPKRNQRAYCNDCHAKGAPQTGATDRLRIRRDTSHGAT